MKLLILALAILLISVDAAHAGPVGAAFAAISTVVKGSAILSGLVQVGISIGLTKLAQRLAAPRQRQPGREIEGMTTGETAGETFIVGRWATGGHMTYQGSYGSSNRRLVRVIELVDTPGHALRGVIIGGEFVEFDGVASEIGPQNDRLFVGEGSIAAAGTGAGAEATNSRLRSSGRGHFWLRYHDGAQTQADAFLLDQFSNADRPYNSDMVGAGICYAVVNFRSHNSMWSGGIEPVFVLDGMPLYDPRLDSAVGGSGPHRWGQPETYSRTFNPIVIAYNAARGIALTGGDVYGGGYGFDDLPLGRWVAAMNVCDARGYEFGAEVNIVETEPADLIDACIEACAGQIAPVGGQLLVQVGAPDVPVWSISDDDVSAEDGVQFDPIRGLADRVNAVQGSYVAPAQLWEPRALPLLKNPTFEAEDGGRRLPADLPLAGVYKAAQAQELVENYLRDGRRQRTHTMVLAPDAARLSMFDTIALTRPQDGYQNKLVEVVGFQQRTDDTFCVVTLREVDPADYTPPAQPLPEPPQPAPLPVLVQEVPGFAVSPTVIVDSDNVARRAGALLVWDFAEFDDVDTLSVEIRRFGTVEPEFTLQLVAETERHIQQLLPATVYEVRAQLIANRETDWTTWRQVQTPDVRLSQADMADELRQEFDAARDLIDGTVENIGGVVGDLRDRIGQILAPVVGPNLPSVPHIARIDQALIDEAQARVDAIAAEAQARAAAVTAEAEARVSDALALAGGIRDVRDRIQRTANELQGLAAFEHLEREEIRTSLTVQVEGARADYTQQITVLAGAQTAIAQQVVTLEAQTDNLGAAITAVDAARIEGDDALAAQIALLSVGSAVQFDHVSIWYWDETVEGWTGSPSAPTVTADGWLVPAAGSYVASPDGLEVSAQAYRQVRARVRNEPGVWADAWLYWAAEGEGWDAARRVEIDAPDWSGDEAQLTINPDWSGVVDRVRLDLPDGVEIDWLAIGRPAPGASSADIAAERAARVALGLALAEEITTLSGQLTTVEGDISANADALSSLTGRVEETEEGVTAVAEDLTALESVIDDPETGLVATGQAVDQLQTRTDSLEDGTSVQSESVRAVRAAQRLQGNSVLDGLAAGFLQDQRALEVVAEAAQALNSRVDVTNEQVAIVAEAVTLLQAAIPGLATAQALQALTVEVEATEEDVSILIEDLTNLIAVIENPETGLAAAHGEITQLNTVDVNSDSALVQAHLGLAAAVNDPETGLPTAQGRIDNLEAVKVDGEGAVAAVNQQISAEYGSLQAMAEATAFAAASASGILSGFIFSLQGQDVISAVAVMPDGSIDPNIVLRFAGNSIILDGNTQVTEAFQVGGVGTGARAVTTKEGLRVYDENNVARVIIGRLD